MTRVELWVQVALVATAGYVLFPVPIGILSWYARQDRRVWLAVSIWAVSVALLAFVTFLGEHFGANGDLIFVTLRATMFDVSLVFFIWVIAEISGGWVRGLTALLVATIVIKAMLWVPTDLFWTKTFDSDGAVIFGPLGSWYNVVVGALAFAIVLVTVRRPWRNRVARKVTAWFALPLIVLAALITAVPIALGPALMVFLFALPVVVIQAVLFNDVATVARQAVSGARRDTVLADFSEQALAPGATVPIDRAVALIDGELAPNECSYTSISESGQREVVATRIGSSTAGDARRSVVGIESGGRTVGELALVGNPTDDDLHFLRAVGIVVSSALSREELEQSLRERAVRDHITGLPNWVGLQGELVALIRSGSGSDVIVSSIDIVGLKTINTEFGYEVGNAVLREVGRLLRAGAESSAIVAKVGIDQFIVGQRVQGRIDYQAVRNQVDEISAAPILAAGQHVPVTLRQGVVLSTDSTDHPDVLVRRSEIALSQAKAESVLFMPYAQTSAAADEREKEHLATQLAEAITNDELFVEYEPLVSLADGNIVGAEALARWELADGRRIPPDQFIPLAQERGLMSELTRRICGQAVPALARWHAVDAGARDMRMSLNVTAELVSSPECFPWLQSLLRANGLSFDRITLELTESAVALASESMLNRLAELRAAGVTLSLDDFGTGHSTLNRLRVLPVGEIKIDQAFTGADAGSHRSVVESVIELARIHHLSVVAEGIETVEQKDLMASDGCDVGQGYWYSRPVNEVDFLALLQNWDARAMAPTKSEQNGKRLNGAG